MSGPVGSGEGPADSRELSWYRLDVEYEGTAFKGWAKQPGQRTVQAELERVLAMLLRRPVALRVAGRTDAGVHAWAQVVSFATAAAVCPDELRLGLNAVLPDDVAVWAVSQAPPGFDARAARSRTYQYRLWVSPVRPVRERRCVWHVHGALDTEVLQAAAGRFVGRRDWSALTPSARLYRTCEREVLGAAWRPGPAAPGARADEWVFDITAESFLHNMVRVAVGTMVDVARGRMSLEETDHALASGERRHMGRTAPARGLALVGVQY